MKSQAERDEIEKGKDKGNRAWRRSGKELIKVNFGAYTMFSRLDLSDVLIEEASRTVTIRHG